MRRALIAPSFSLEDEQTQDALELPDTEDTQQQVIERICRQQLSLAVQRLEPKFRTPILLMYGFGMSIEQIAQIERVPKGTIKSRIESGKKEIAQGNGGVWIWRIGTKKTGNGKGCCEKVFPKKNRKSRR